MQDCLTLSDWQSLAKSDIVRWSETIIFKDIYSEQSAVQLSTEKPIKNYVYGSSVIFITF